jgi:hypothetical protein
VRDEVTPPTVLPETLCPVRTTRYDLTMARGRLAIFTICSNNYLPMAKVLFASAERHCPHAELFLCLGDERLPERARYPTDARVVTAEELDIPDFRDFAFRYSIMEFNTALKPFMIRHLLEQGFDAVLYFDPDIAIYAPLDVVLDPLREGFNFVLTPHLCQPAEGDAYPDDLGIMRAGVYNLGFIGVGAGIESDRLLRWWSRRLRYHCVSDQDHGVFVDQKFIDLLPGFTNSVRIVRDSGCNVAYWNLQQRNLTQDGESWLVDTQMLRFFHFSAMNITDLNYLSKWTQAFRGADISPALNSLMQHYADQVVAAGYDSEPLPGYSYARFASGTPITDPVRRMFRERHLSWLANPFETYEEYLHLPAPGRWAGSPTCMITNLMDDLWQRTPWLAAHFNLATREGVEGYTDWFLRNGQGLLGDAKLIEPVAMRFAAGKPRRPTDAAIGA